MHKRIMEPQARTAKTEPGRTWRRGVGGALAALSLATTPLPSSAECQRSSVELPAPMVGRRAVATIAINGTPVPMIVDSGADGTMLTHAAAQELGLEVGSLGNSRVMGLTGAVEAGKTKVQRLSLPGREMTDFELVVGGNDEANGTKGMLGRDLLDLADIEYDLANGMIRLTTPSDDCRGAAPAVMAYWAGERPVSSVGLQLERIPSKHPAILAIGDLNNRPVRILFDTGAQSLVSLAAARRAGLTELKPNGHAYGLGRGEARAWTTEIDRFELGGEKISNVRLTVADFDMRHVDMLLGIDFFLSHRIYVSRQQGRMFFTYNGGRVFAYSDVEEPVAAAAEPANEPADAAAYARRGAAAAARFDHARALADLDRACELAPDVAEYFLRRGIVREQMRQARSAQADYDRALLLDPGQTEARLRLAAKDGAGALDDAQRLDQDLPAQSHQRLGLARAFERLEQPRRALAQWDLWVPAHPHDLQLDAVLNSRCRTRMLLGAELDKALADCDRAIALRDKEASYLDSRGWVQLRRGEPRKALADYERALALKPDSAWTLYGRGIARGRLGEIEAGRADLEAARKLSSTIDAEAARWGLAAEFAASGG